MQRLNNVEQAGLSAAEQLELQWDYWMINGLVKHSLNINKLMKARHQLEESGKKPDYSYTDLL